MSKSVMKSLQEQGGRCNTKTCQECGSEYTPIGTNWKLCSTECYDDRRKRFMRLKYRKENNLPQNDGRGRLSTSGKHLRARGPTGRANYTERECVECGREYHPTSGTQKRCVDCHSVLHGSSERSRHLCPQCMKPLTPTDVEKYGCIVRTWSCLNCDGKEEEND